MSPVIIDKNFLELLTVAFGGFIGAFVKDLLLDGCIELPYKQDGKVFLGFIGGGIIGAFVGVVIDGSFITAAMAGYTGSSILSNLVISKTNISRTLNKLKSPETKKDKEEIKTGV